ncbi:hypothetical protein ACJX0J_009385, partial [Zea mays]
CSPTGWDGDLSQRETQTEASCPAPRSDEATRRRRSRRRAPASRCRSRCAHTSARRLRSRSVAQWTRPWPRRRERHAVTVPAPVGSLLAADVVLHEAAHHA